MRGVWASTLLCLLFNTTRHTHTLRTPKHESLYRYGRRCGLRAGGQYGAHLDLWGVTVELRALAISLCVDASRRAHYLNCLLNCRQGRLSPRPALPGTCTHVHMYCMRMALPRRYRHSVFGYQLLAMSGPWFESHHQRPDPSSILLSYKSIMLNCGTERHGESGLRSAQSLSVFELATVASQRPQSTQQ